MDIFKNLQNENRAIVLVTHDLEIAEQMDRVVSMRDGKIIADDLRSERTDSLEDRFWETGKGGKLGVTMNWFREILNVALGGLTARKVRTLLIMLGPVLGAAGIVAAVGLNESAKGDVRQTLERLELT